MDILHQLLLIIVVIYLFTLFSCIALSLITSHLNKIFLRSFSLTHVSSTAAPITIVVALQVLRFCHQSIHIEGVLLPPPHCHYRHGSFPRQISFFIFKYFSFNFNYYLVYNYLYRKLVSLYCS